MCVWITLDLLLIIINPDTFYIVQMAMTHQRWKFMFQCSGVISNLHCIQFMAPAEQNCDESQIRSRQQNVLT